MGRARGQWRDLNGVRVMPTFHPAYLLRSPDKKREVWEDMKKVRDYLNSLSGSNRDSAAALNLDSGSST
jgi:DNA polymerase